MARKKPVIYAIGDIHGMLRQLVELVAHIREDAEQYYQGRNKTVVFIGDYIDRGPHSRQVISYVRSRPLKAAKIRQVCLKGNHEDLMEHHYNGADTESWLANGGRETLASYKRGFVIAEHRRWISRLRTSYVAGRYLFAHAGVDPNRPLHDQSAHDLMWVRDPFLEHPETFTYKKKAVKVVHGHSPHPDPVIYENSISLDTGAYFTGCLSAAVLDGEEERIIQAKGEPAPGYEHLAFD